jgi:pilus retraction protein PilT
MESALSPWGLSSPECLRPGFLLPATQSPEEMAATRRVLEGILAECLEHRASDFDLAPGRPISLNTGAGLLPGAAWGKMTQDQVVAILGLLYLWRFQEPDAALHRPRMEQLEAQMLTARCADFACTVPGDTWPRPRIRVHAYLCESGLAMTCRILSALPPAHDALGLPESVVESLSSLLQKKSGLGLVTGPTGSGKTSTLAAFLNQVRTTSPKKIVTVEDPIEILYEEGGTGAVIQQEVRRDVSSFGDGLRSILRKRPDIILLGEIRDAESMQTCLEATQTGHLVLATLHTRGVASTLRRITEFFPAERGPQILSACAESLLFILSQGLLPRAGSNGRALVCEFLLNKETARPAIAKYLSTPQALREVLRKPHNVEWNAAVRSLVERGLVEERHAREAILEEGSKPELGA